jgi:hypothetical protein
MEKDQQVAILTLPQPGAAAAGGEVRLLPASPVKSPYPMPRPLVNPVADHFR